MVADEERPRAFAKRAHAREQRPADRARAVGADGEADLVKDERIGGGERLDEQTIDGLIGERVEWKRCQIDGPIPA